jgi:O-antigen/teichoic acid export membrane protein
MTAFSTTRTISNVSLQGIGTVTNPVMPELMRYLREHDESRMNSVIGFLLFLTVILLAPILIFIQLIIPDIFLLWTRGKIEFDAPLFGIFSISLLFYAVARPAFAIVQGNNLVKVQLIISTVVGLFAIGGVILMSKFYGIRGAASALLLAEIFGCILALVFTVRWLASNHMKLPWHLFYLSFTSILIAMLAIALMALMPNLRIQIFICAFILCNFVGVFFVKKLPAIAIEKLKAIIYKTSWRKLIS